MAPLPRSLLVLCSTPSGAAAAAAGRVGALLRRKIGQQRRLRSDDLFERIAGAHLFAISGVAFCRWNAADADRADELAIDDDRQAALLRGQAVAGHVLIGEGVLDVAVIQ